MNEKVEQVLQVIAQALDIPVEQITLDTQMSEIPDWDSLAQVMVMSALDEELGIKIPIEQMITIQSMRDIVRLGGLEQ